MINLSFLDAMELGETILPQVPQVVAKNLGQPKPAPEAKPQAPQVAPSENNVKVSETSHSGRRFSERNDLAAFGKSLQIVRPLLHHRASFFDEFRSVVGGA